MPFFETFCGMALLVVVTLVLFYEGINLLYRREWIGAIACVALGILISPGFILFNYYWGRQTDVLSNWRRQAELDRQAFVLIQKCVESPGRKSTPDW